MFKFSAFCFIVSGSIPIFPSYFGRVSKYSCAFWFELSVFADKERLNASVNARLCVNFIFNPYKAQQSTFFKE